MGRRVEAAYLFYDFISYRQQVNNFIPYLGKDGSTMKAKYKLFSVMLAVCLIFPAFASYVGAYSETQQCLHNTLYDFDNETMTVKGVYEGNRIEAFFADVRFYSDAEDTAVVLQNGVPVTEGVFQEGMIVQIYHGDTLYGEYRIEELLEPFSIAPPENGPMRAAAANAYGFTLPLDNMNLTSHVSAAFGSDFGGPNTGYPDHRGADFSWGGITGTPIRAIKSGTVDATNIHSSYGNHVRIDHGNGQKSLYAHMSYEKNKNMPLVSNGQWVEQGEIIGYVGSTGNVTGPHLHLEIQINGALVNRSPTLPVPLHHPILSLSSITPTADPDPWRTPSYPMAYLH